HVDAPSSHVDWTAGEVRLLTEATPWPETGRPRRAAVSSFGISGTNAHTVLEQAPAVTAAAPEPATALAVLPFTVSGKTPAALRAQATRLLTRLGDDPAGTGLADLALSLATSRTAFEHRAVFLGSSTEDVVAGLTALGDGAPLAGLTEGVADLDGQIVFVFPGQGAQWAGMGARLLDESPEFAAKLTECAEALSAYVDWSLPAVLRQEDGAPALDRVDVIQPASFAVMVALAELWRSRGIVPDAVVGHSQGEIAAA
ncbi:acyltransferase domain-containing protein, partial [Amycolatopsis sp. SID8362]|uniref:acyltransferase domain-containing protein n=1 Tax=Amycolatopsis sp. SID8362 TaxID=2690346 RepID=UPI00136EA03E